MKKKSFYSLSAIFVFIISVLTYKTYNYDNTQQNVNFRIEPEQDSQVKNNESMVSKSLANAPNNQNIDKQQMTEATSQDSGTFMMSNHVSNNSILSENKQ